MRIPLKTKLVLKTSGSVIWTKSNLSRSFKKSLDPQISSLVHYFKKINAFLVYSICFHETVHDKRFLEKIVGQIENGLERGFV